jgi:hypothetical protein
MQPAAGTAPVIQRMWQAPHQYLGQDQFGHLWRAPNGFVYYGGPPMFQQAAAPPPQAGRGAGRGAAPAKPPSRALPFVDPKTLHSDWGKGTAKGLEFQPGWTRFQTKFGSFSKARIEAILAELHNDGSANWRVARMLWLAMHDRLGQLIRGREVIEIEWSRLDVVEGIHEAASEGPHITVQLTYKPKGQAPVTLNKVHVNVTNGTWLYKDISHNLDRYSAFTYRTRGELALRPVRVASGPSATSRDDDRRRFDEWYKGILAGFHSGSTGPLNTTREGPGGTMPYVR